MNTCRHESWQTEPRGGTGEFRTLETITVCQECGSELSQYDTLPAHIKSLSVRLQYEYVQAKAEVKRWEDRIANGERAQFSEGKMAEYQFGLSRAQNQLWPWEEIGRRVKVLEVNYTNGPLMADTQWGTKTPAGVVVSWDDEWSARSIATKAPGHSLMSRLVSKTEWVERD